MSLRNRATRIFHDLDLDNGEPDFLACAAIPTEVGSSYLVPTRIVVLEGLDNVFGIALNGGHLESVRTQR